MAEYHDVHSPSGQTGDDLSFPGSSTDSPLADDESSQPGPSGINRSRKMMSIREALMRSGAYGTKMRGKDDKQSESSNEGAAPVRKIRRLEAAAGNVEEQDVDPEKRFDTPSPGADVLIAQNTLTGMTRWYPQDPYSLLADESDESIYKPIGNLYNTVHLDQYFRSRINKDFVKAYLNRGNRENNLQGYFFRTRSDQPPAHSKYGNVSYVISFKSLLDFCATHNMNALYLLDVCQTKDECKTRYLITDSAEKFYEHQWEYDNGIFGGAWHGTRGAGSGDHKYAGHIREFRTVHDYSIPNELEFFVVIRERLSRKLFKKVSIVAEDHSDANNEDNCHRYRSGQSDDWTICPYPYSKEEAHQEIRRIVQD